MTHILLALVVGAFVFLSYRQGLKDGMRKEKGEELRPVVSKPRQKHNEGTDKTAEKWGTIIANIDTYDGTPKGQKKVV